MPRPAINLHKAVRALLQHTSPLPSEADCPIQHFEISAAVGLSLIKYIDDHVEPKQIYESVFDRHIGHLNRMVLAELLETFERFLKELAAVCIDFLAPYAADDRFDEFLPKRSDHIAVFVNASSIGRALCESDTWLNNSSINRRFKLLLKDHFGKDWECVFPEQSQTPEVERDRAATMMVLWQIRHTLAHNVGVITHSDSMKFRMLVKSLIAAGQRLAPSLNDLKYVQRFLYETAVHTNKRVGVRLAELLDGFYLADNGLFDPQTKAHEVSRRFALLLTIQGRTGAI